jgi:hypothetical protein
VILKFYCRLFNNFSVKMMLFINLINIIVFYVKFSIKLIYHMLTFYIKYFPIKVVTPAEPEVTGQYKLHNRTQHWMDFHIQLKNPECQLSQILTVFFKNPNKSQTKSFKVSNKTFSMETISAVKPQINWSDNWRQNW